MYSTAKTTSLLSIQDFFWVFPVAVFQIFCYECNIMAYTLIPMFPRSRGTSCDSNLMLIWFSIYIHSVQMFIVFCSCLIFLYWYQTCTTLPSPRSLHGIFFHLSWDMTVWQKNIKFSFLIPTPLSSYFSSIINNLVNH